MKNILICFFITNILFSFKSNSATDGMDRAIYRECETCYTNSELVAFGQNDFINNYTSDENQWYAYTVVNHSAKLAVFVDFKHYYRTDHESGETIDVIIPSILTGDTEMNADYYLSDYAIRDEKYLSSSKASKPKVVEITISGSMGVNAETTMFTYSSAISSALRSHLGGGQSWSKLAGRAILIITFDNGKLGAFFYSIYVTSPYQYLSDTAVDNDGQPKVMYGGATSVTSGGGGITTSGSGSWTIISGGAIGCTSIDGGSPKCEWIHF